MHRSLLIALAVATGCQDAGLQKHNSSPTATITAATGLTSSTRVAPQTGSSAVASAAATINNTGFSSSALLAVSTGTSVASISAVSAILS